MMAEQRDGAGWGRLSVRALGTQKSVCVGCLLLVLRKHVSLNKLYWIVSSVGLEGHKIS